MFCLAVSAGALAVGVYYLATGYQIPVGWVQVILGTLCISLVLLWKISERRDKKSGKTEGEIPAERQQENAK